MNHLIEALQRAHENTPDLRAEREAREAANAERRTRLSQSIRQLRDQPTKLSQIETAISSLMPWRDFLVESRQTLVEELAVLDARSSDPKVRGRAEGLRLSLVQIDRGGLDFRNQLLPRRLPLDDPLAAAGFAHGGTLAETVGAHWHGSLPVAEERLETLTEQRDYLRREMDRLVAEGEALLGESVTV